MLTLCIALHLYAGPIEPGTPVTELARECAPAKIAKVRREVAKCIKQGPDKCEVVTKGQTITIETKLQTKQ